MMAALKFVALMVVGLCAMQLEAEAGKSLSSIAEEIAERLNGLGIDLILTGDEKADAEKVYSFANRYVSQLNKLDKPTGEELVTAWKNVLHSTNWFKLRNCDESSLGYIKTISSANPKSKPELRTLEEATKKYARDCVKKHYIEDKLNSQRYVYARRRVDKDLIEFADDQFIADYWLDYPKDKSEGMPVERNKAAKAIAKAIVRARGDDAYELEYVGQVHDYLRKSLYKPCLEYWNSYKELYFQILTAKDYLEGGYQRLFSSLDNKSQNALSRFQVCMNDMTFLRQHAGPLSDDQAFETSKLVSSELKKLLDE